ncbi:MAG: radical SAM protein [Candidatus Omnitrophota bacterium]
MPWKAASSPHFALEINKKCNISCKGCYKKLDGTTKDMKHIMLELDALLSKRRIQTVSICGGEPTLHPELCDIVNYIHSKKIKTSLVTNGLILDGSLLDRLKKSGLDIVMLHIDEGQDRPDLFGKPREEGIRILRSKMAAMIASRGMDVGISVTIYKENLPSVRGLVRSILESENINYLFATNYFDPRAFVKQSMLLRSGSADRGPWEETEKSRTTNRDIQVVLERDLLLEPFSYLPYDGLTTGENADFSWISYYVPVMRSGDGYEIFRIRSNRFDKMLIHAHRLVSGRFAFYFKHKPAVTAARVIINAVTTGRMREGVDFIKKSKKWNTGIRAKSFVFESGPRLTKNGEISCCVFCPNATLRDKKLVHLCLADSLEEIEQKNDN